MIAPILPQAFGVRRLAAALDNEGGAKGGISVRYAESLVMSQPLAPR